MSQYLMNSIVEGNINQALDILHRYQTGELQLDLDGLFKSNPTSDSAKVSSLHEACKRGCTDIVELLLLYGASPNIATPWGATPLHFAATEGRLAEVKLLLDCGSHIVSTSMFGRTACHYAAAFGHIMVVQCFLDHGFNIDEQDSQKGWTLLHHAANRGHMPMVKMLVGRHARSDILDFNGMTALQVAQNIRDGECLPLLLDPANPLDEVDHAGVQRSKAAEEFQVETNIKIPATGIIHENTHHKFSSYLPNENDETMRKYGIDNDFDKTSEKKLCLNNDDESVLSNPKKRLAAEPFHAVNQGHFVARWSIEDMCHKVAKLEIGQELTAHKVQQLEEENERMKKKIANSSCVTCSPLNSIQQPQCYTIEQAKIVGGKVQRNLVEITKRICVDEHVPYLLQEDALSMAEYEEIESERAETKKSHRLMMILLKKQNRGDIRWVCPFMKSLSTINQCTADLASTILST